MGFKASRAAPRSAMSSSLRVSDSSHLLPMGLAPLDTSSCTQAACGEEMTGVQIVNAARAEPQTPAPAEVDMMMSHLCQPPHACHQQGRLSLMQILGPVLNQMACHQLRSCAQVTACHMGRQMPPDTSAHLNAGGRTSAQDWANLKLASVMLVAFMRCPLYEQASTTMPQRSCCPMINQLGLNQQLKVPPCAGRC